MPENKVKGLTVRVDTRFRLQIPSWLRREREITPGKKYSLVAMEDGALIYRPKSE